MDALGETWIGRALREHVGSRRVRVWGVLLAALALALAAAPLFGVVGFEFAFAMAVPASLASADLGAALVRRARALEIPAPHRALAPGAAVFALWAGAAGVALALLIPPLAIAALNAFREPTCEWGFGLAAYLLMPGLSAILASAVGVVAALATTRRRLGYALPYLVILAAAVASVWRFYASPPAFSFNAFLGYFPGNLYDEELRFPAAFFWARAHQGAAAVAALAGAAALVDVSRLVLARPGARRPRGLRPRPLALFVLAAGAATALWATSGKLGFSVGQADIADVLGKRYETENFVIYYPGGGAIERDIEAIAADHEFRYAQVTTTLGAEPSGKITSYYFPDAETKHRLIGARHVHMAKPWRREIYVGHRPFPHGVLRHEIAHVVAGAFGDPIFRVSARRVLGVPLFFNPGLIEGIAVAADWPDRFANPLTPHQSAKAMIELDYAPDPDQLFSTRFLALSSARGYTLAGSVVKFLLDEYGAEQMRALYRSGGDFEAAYGAARGEMLAEWRAMIDAIELSEAELERVREQFRRPGIFARPCPRTVARERARAHELSSRGEGREAAAIMEGVVRADPAEPRHRLELGDFRVRAGDPSAAARAYRELADDGDEVTASLRAEALTSLGDLEARRGALQRAAGFFERAAELPAPAPFVRAARAKLGAVSAVDPAARAARAYFWGHDPKVRTEGAARAGRAAEVAFADPDDALGHYLFGLNLRGRGAPEEAARALERALDRGLDDGLLSRNAARELAAAGFLAGDTGAVERAADLLDHPDQPRVERLYGRDWRERLAFHR